MATLNEFAKKNNTRSGYAAWREKTPENQQAWKEAVEGFKSGLAISVIVKWLKSEKNCPLSYHTIRTQLHEGK
jgi:ferric-dicitrate binding protein FerR (iron transport regulator)|tara:strand:- start:2742 stop:2960 length:219 start_codon:yes stop_codon:yes gene_type:complete